ALSLGMIFHELGTNAAKYGSLSVEHGRLDVTWSVETHSRAQLVIDWAENDGPKPTKVAQPGFGLSLIEREVAHGLGGKVKIDFADGGWRANLRVPLE